MKLCPQCQRLFDDTDAVCPSDGKTLVSSREGSRLIADKYRLERRLGRGGMGTVYGGTHLELDRPVAVKLLSHDLVADADALERFRREARATARLNHPHIADTFDYGQTPDGAAYIVMELVDGHTLRELLNRDPLFPVLDAILVIEQVADGIEAAHIGGIIHRDLKPSNILLSQDHHSCLQAKVVDFGIAKLREHSTMSGDLTGTGMLIGTPRYMSPEQCEGHNLDARSDIYSLGVILYEMLAGRTPFDAQTATGIALKHIHEAPPPIEQFRENLPDDLRRLLMQLLAKRPEDRPQTAIEVARQLRKIERQLRQEGDVTLSCDDAPTQVALDRHNERKNVSPVEQTTHVAALQTEVNIQSPNAASNLAGERRDDTSRSGSPTREDDAPERSPALATDPSHDISLAQPLSVDARVGTAENVVETHEASNATASAAGRTGEDVADGSVALHNQFDNATNSNAPNVASNLNAQATPLSHAQPEAPLVDPSVQSYASTLAQTSSAPAPTTSAYSTHSAVVSASSKKRSYAIYYVVVAVAALASFGAAFALVFRAAGDETTQQANNVPAATPGAERNSNAPDANNAPPTRTAITTTTPVKPANGATLTPAERRAALQSSLDGWVNATNSHDIDRVLAFYAAKLVRYYLKTNVAQSVVRADKAATFGDPSFVQISISELNYEIDQSGRAALMRFRKDYKIMSSNGGDKRGAVLQELQWQLIGDEWKIVSERDLRAL